MGSMSRSRALVGRGGRRARYCPRERSRRGEGGFQAAESVRSRVPMRGAPADPPVVAVKPLRIAVGVEPRGGVVQVSGCDQPEGRNRMHEPKLQGRSQIIPKQLVWDAWLKVKENNGAAGADGVTVEQFEAKLKAEPP